MKIQQTNPFRSNKEWNDFVDRFNPDFWADMPVPKGRFELGKPKSYPFIAIVKIDEDDFIQVDVTNFVYLADFVKEG